MIFLTTEWMRLASQKRLPKNRQNMKVITFTDVDWSCVRLWFSRAFPNVVGIRANGIVVGAANADKSDITMQDIDTLSKIEAFYHASETNDPDNNTSFKY